MSNNLTKKEQRELKKQEKFEVSKKTRRIQAFKRAGKVALFVCSAWVVVFGIGWIISKNAPVISESDVISRKGIHWHAELKIFINGQEKEIPANIGIGAIHQPLHTHAVDGVIHMEFDGLVTKKDVRLGQFFDNWNKKFDKNCVFEYCNGAEGMVKMLVNGRPNSDFENYEMKDGDKIEIRYE